MCFLLLFINVLTNTLHYKLGTLLWPWKTNSCSAGLLWCLEVQCCIKLFGAMWLDFLGTHYWYLFRALELVGSCRSACMRHTLLVTVQNSCTFWTMQMSYHRTHGWYLFRILELFKVLWVGFSPHIPFLYPNSQLWREMSVYSIYSHSSHK